jgi:hypothetical protein
MRSIVIFGLRPGRETAPVTRLADEPVLLPGLVVLEDSNITPPCDSRRTLRRQGSPVLFTSFRGPGGNRTRAVAGLQSAVFLLHHRA